MSDIILSVKDITKHFRHIRALDGVSAEVREGSITAIVGDNGSGKSTLIKILSGTLRPDGGSMTVCGAEHPFLTVQRAMELGIRTVYQDLSLDNCKNSVENIFLGDELMHGPFLDRRAMRLEAERLLNDIRVNVPDLSEPVRNLSGGQRQGVAIARALRRPGRLLLLDEPTAAMGIHESHRTMGLLKELRDPAYNQPQPPSGIRPGGLYIRNALRPHNGGSGHTKHLAGRAKELHTAPGGGSAMKDLKRFVDRNIAPLLLLCFCGIMAAFLSVRTNSFFSVKNAVNILEANSYRMLIAVGMMCIISSGAIDLSVGSMLSFSAICMAKALKAELPVGLCVGVALLMGASMGALNGVLMHVTRINAFIITLATSYMYRGLSLIATQGIPITKLPQAFRDFGCGDIFGMESGVTMALMAVIALIPIFYFMRWGSYVMSLGSNPEALKRSGVKIWKYRVSAFALMGLLSSVAGVIVTARLNSAEANAGLNMEMEAICAVIMGGTALHGGKGSLPGTVIAVILLGLIRNGLTVMSVSSYYQQFVTGALLLIAVVTAELRERRNRIG